MRSRLYWLLVSPYPNDRRSHRNSLRGSTPIDNLCRCPCGGRGRTLVSAMLIPLCTHRACSLITSFRSGVHQGRKDRVACLSKDRLVYSTS